MPNPEASNSADSIPTEVHPPLSLYHDRRQRLRKSMQAEAIEAYLVTDEINVTYLTGFSGDSSFLLITLENELLVSDTRYTTQIEEECGSIEKVIRNSGTTTAELLCNEIKKLTSASVAVEYHKITKQLFDQIEAESSSPLVNSKQLVEKLRAIKDDYEVGEIRRSIAMAETVFNKIRCGLHGKQTEAEVAHLLEHEIRLLGGDRCAFEPIVGVGERAALPHAIKTQKRIDESTFVLIDWGAKAGKYMSDLTRVLITGDAPSKLQEIYEIVLDAQLKAIEKIGPGVSIREVDSAARGHIADQGYGDHFGHGLGHGFGLQIHETPLMSPNAEGELREGMVVTVEPGIYLPNWGGVRIEDDILVTADGHEVLTSIPKSYESARVDLG